MSVFQTTGPSGKEPFFSSNEARRLAWLGGILVVLLALALNIHVISFDFAAFDDDINVYFNPHLGGLTVQRLKWMFADSAYVRRYMPFGWLTFSLIYEIGGLVPSYYHGAALAFYVANTALVFVLILHLLRVYLPNIDSLGLNPWLIGASLLAAAWWALHPLRVESTAWVSGMLYGQSMFFFLCALIIYVRSYLTCDFWKGRKSRLAVVLTGYILSLLTYPLASGGAILLLACDWLYCRRTLGINRWQLILEKFIFLVPAIAILVLTVHARLVPNNFRAASPTLTEFSVGNRLIQAAYVACYYLWRPWSPINLSPSYDTLFEFNPFDWPFIGSIIGVCTISAIALIFVRKHPWIMAAWVAYLAILTPFFGFTEAPHYTSDRYGYFVTVICAVLLAAILSRIRRPVLRILCPITGIFFIGTMGWLSWRQTEIWANGHTVFRRIITQMAEGEMREDNIGKEILLYYIEGRESYAEKTLNEQLRFHPDSTSLKRITAIIRQNGQRDMSRRGTPMLALYHHDLGISFAKEGSLHEADEHLRIALECSPNYYQAAYDRALILLQLSRSRDALDNYLWAEAHAPHPLPEANCRFFLKFLLQVANKMGEQHLAQILQIKIQSFRSIN